MVFFWNELTFDDFLIQGLNITSSLGFSTVILILVAMSALYEGIRVFRDLLLDHYIEMKKRCLIQAGNKTFQVKYFTDDTLGIIPAVQNHDNKCSSNEIELTSISNDSSLKMSAVPPLDVNGVISSSNRWSSCLILMAATILHMICVFVGYTLMLAVMTFNVWVLCGVVIGTGFGYFVFSHLRQTMRPLKDTNS